MSLSRRFLPAVTVASLFSAVVSAQCTSYTPPYVPPEFGGPRPTATSTPSPSAPQPGQPTTPAPGNPATPRPTGAPVTGGPCLLYTSDAADE